MGKQNKSQKRNPKKELTVEEKINSALLYTPELFTWAKKDDSK